jgi:hypothetical protein
MTRSAQTIADLDDGPPTTTADGREGVELRSARDYSLVTTALHFRVDDLKKLGKRNREDGYTAEARAVESDAASIEEFILPQFHAQRELPLATADSVRAMVKDALWATVHRYAVVFDQSSSSAKDEAAFERMQGKREDELASELARVVAMFAVSVAEGSYAAGFASRSMTAEHLASRALPALRGFPDGHAD